MTRLKWIDECLAGFATMLVTAVFAAPAVPTNGSVWTSTAADETGNSKTFTFGENQSFKIGSDWVVLMRDVKLTLLDEPNSTDVLLEMDAAVSKRILDMGMHMRFFNNAGAQILEWNHGGYLTCTDKWVHKPLKRSHRQHGKRDISAISKATITFAGKVEARECESSDGVQPF